MWIGKLFHVRQVWFFYIARFGNWLAIAMMWFFAIRIVPRHKMLFVVLYSMPTNIVYSCTSSTDGLLNALIMLLIAIAIKAYYDETELTDKRILIPVMIISAYISVIKLPYVLVAYSLVALSLRSENKKYNFGKIIRDIAIITGICVFVLSGSDPNVVNFLST